MITYSAITKVNKRKHAEGLGLALEKLDPAPSGVGVFELEDGSGEWEVGAYFIEKPDEISLLLLENAFDAGGFVISKIPETDWVAKVKRELSPVEAGRFFVCGKHDLKKTPTDRVGLLIEASMAFGTGHHGTTKGCLLALDKILLEVTNLKNVIEATINKTDNLDIGKLKRNFVTNSSCGICGKTSLDSIEVLKNDKLDLSFPKIKEDIILKSPSLLMNEQSEFAKTGGIHASALIDEAGKVIATREDVGRHNALDKLLGHSIQNGLLDPKVQFIACSGRLNFELVQKGLMANIGIMAGVGAPTSLAVDLAKRFDMTLLGFVKESGFNIYSNKDRIILG